MTAESPAAWRSSAGKSYGVSGLKELPLHRLKIDRSFIVGLPGDAGAMAISRAIVEMGHGLSLQVVAEGVETPAQHEAVRAMGCDGVQGYLVAVPMAEAALRQWMRGRGGGGAPLDASRPSAPSSAAASRPE